MEYKSICDKLISYFISRPKISNKVIYGYCGKLNYNLAELRYLRFFDHPYIQELLFRKVYFFKHITRELCKGK